MGSKDDFGSRGQIKGLLLLPLLLLIIRLLLMVPADLLDDVHTIS